MLHCVIKWAGVWGLCLDFVGAVFLTYGLVISKQEAAKLGSSYYGATDWRENLKLPPVADRLKTSRNAIIGIAFVFAGFIGQVLSAWPKSS